MNRVDYEDLLEIGGSPFLERPRNLNPFHPDNQTKDPANYYIPIPERDRVKVPGTMIESHIERDLRQFMEMYGDKWRTMADIARSGYYLFHSLVVATNSTWEALNQVKAAARLRRLELDIEFSAKDKKIVDTCRRVWEKISKELPHRTDLRNQITADLRTYARGIDPEDESRIAAFWDEVRKVEGMSVAAEPAPKIADTPQDAPEPIVGDEALESLSEESTRG